MNPYTHDHIRQIFLSERPNFVLMTAFILLGMEYRELLREIADGAIVAGSTRLGQRISREEMIAAAFRRYEQSVIEEALGDAAAAVLPEALRLVELRARVPLYQREMLRYFADRDGTSADTVLSGHLDDVRAFRGASGASARLRGRVRISVADIRAPCEVHWDRSTSYGSFDGRETQDVRVHGDFKPARYDRRRR